MGVSRVMGSCKSLVYSTVDPTNYNNNNNNPKSISFPTNFQIPKSLTFSANSKPNSKTSKLCCSSLSSSRFSVSKKLLSLEKFKGSNDNFRNFFDNLLFDEIPQQVLSITVLLVDEDRKLRQKFSELVDKEKNETDVEKKANIVLDEVVPHLLENADLCISSCLIVSSNMKEAFLKLVQSEQMIPNKLTLRPGEDDAKKMDASNTVLCTEVFVDVTIAGIIDNKFKEIHTREDFRALLRHLMSMEGVTVASAMCVGVLVSKERTKALEEYSHATT